MKTNRGALTVLAFVIGLQQGVADFVPRDLSTPKGYPLAWDYSECDKPETLNEDAWVDCVFRMGW
jgi:hypothetical protein